MTDISSYDRWRLDPFNPCEVIVIHDGLDELRRPYGSDRHAHTIAVYDTPEEARAAVEWFNGGG